MIFDILLWVVPIIIGLVFLVDAWDMAWDAPDYILAVVFGALFGFLAWIGCIALYALFAYVILPRDLTFEQRGLVTIQDTQSVQGTFFLGSGSVGGVPKYSFYQREGAASRLRQVDADGVKVYQDTAKPYVLVETGCTSSWEWLAQCGYDGDKVHEIHVPAGTIKTDLVLDAKL